MAIFVFAQFSQISFAQTFKILDEKKADDAQALWYNHFSLLQVAITAPVGQEISLTVKENSEYRDIGVINGNAWFDVSKLREYKYEQTDSTDILIFTSENIGFHRLNVFDSMHYEISISTLGHTFFNYSNSDKILAEPNELEVTTEYPKLIYSKIGYILCYADLQFQMKQSGDPICNTFILWNDSTAYKDLASLAENLSEVAFGVSKNCCGYGYSYDGKQLEFGFPSIMQIMEGLNQKGLFESYCREIAEFSNLQHAVLKNGGTVVIERLDENGKIYISNFPFGNFYASRF